MKELHYSIKIAKPRDFVFKKIMDKSVYPDWAKAWGEGMTYEGEWKKGEHISFFHHTQGGTKVIIENIIPNELIKTKHVAMINSQKIEVVPDALMQKWIGSQENYYFKEESDTETTLTIVMIADEAFEKVMEAWTKALQFFKEICEN